MMKMEKPPSGLSSSAMHRMRQDLPQRRTPVMTLHSIVMAEAANLIQVVFPSEQTNAGSDLHWSRRIKLVVYRGILYRSNDLYPHN